MKKPQVFRGVATALITPFKYGAIDYTALDKLIEMQISGGVSALVIGGTTGESATLDEGERRELYKYAYERVAGRVAVILGVGTNDTRASVKYTEMAQEIGCDAVLAVTPYYNKGTFSGVESHYLAIADSTDLPVILYNVPARTGVNLTFEQLEHLAKHKRIVAIKEASDSADRLVTLAAFGEDLQLYAGNDSQIYTVLSLGGVGVISVVSNLLPVYTSRICDAYFEGKAAESLKMQLDLLPLINALFSETNPTPIKYAMSSRGLCKNELRLPLAPATEATRAIVDKILEKQYE
jgi:4-hydroxy-tetrahydrodipicolinate synthase